MIKRKVQNYQHWRGCSLVLLAIIGVLLQLFILSPKTEALSCPDLRIIFARGSGAEKDTNDDFLEFKQSIEEKIGTLGIWHEYIDLDYTAKGVGIDDIDTLFGAFFGAGEAYDFGASVNDGVNKLNKLLRDCPSSKYVLGGYSQGAMVVSKSLRDLDGNQIIYAATFGDPKIYLPEGKAIGSLSLLEPLNGTEKNLLHTGLIPAACKNENLSEYRAYVPDCYAYEGMLGSYRPYQPTNYSGKLGTWCNTYDIFCSSYLSVSSHTSYVSDKLYNDAAKVIASKIAETFGLTNNYISPHDTAILIDSTGSMGALIHEYKNEALNLATKTLEQGGRVALYDYRDIGNGYEPKERCNFSTCNIETFKNGLDLITPFGGGDTEESLLSASFKIMNKLEWQYGATKSVVVLTDAGYHNPDLDETTFDQVVALSKSIDPVNFYIITPNNVMKKYDSLAVATDGKVVSSSSNLTELTDAIIKRFDSLPRVEEDIEFDPEIPMLTVTNIESIDNSVTVRFLNSGTRVLVALNDAILGVTDEDFVQIDGIDQSVSNTLRLIPMSETRKGEGVEVDLNDVAIEIITPKEDIFYKESGTQTINGIIIPKAPNAGKK